MWMCRSLHRVRILPWWLAYICLGITHFPNQKENYLSLSFCRTPVNSWRSEFQKGCLSINYLITWKTFKHCFELIHFRDECHNYFIVSPQKHVLYNLKELHHILLIFRSRVLIRLLVQSFVYFVEKVAEL